MGIAQTFEEMVTKILESPQMRDVVCKNSANPAGVALGSQQGGGGGEGGGCAC